MAASRTHCPDWVQLFLILTSAVLPCAITQPVAAAEVKIGGRPLAFEPTVGYCLFDKNHPAEAKAINDMRKFYAPTEIMVWLFGECAHRDQWLSPSPTTFGRGGSVYVTKRQAIFRAAETMTRAQFLDEMVRTQPWRIAYKDFQQRAERAGFAFRVDNIKVLSRDDSAIYVGTTFAVRTVWGWIKVVEVNGITMVNKLPVTVEISDGEKSKEALLEEVKAHMRALIAGNEPRSVRDSHVIEQPSTSAVAQ